MFREILTLTFSVRRTGTACTPQSYATGLYATELCYKPVRRAERALVKWSLCNFQELSPQMPNERWHLHSQWMKFFAQQ